MVVKAKYLDNVYNAKTRTDLIEAVVYLFGYKSYLELGCQGNVTFDRIQCERKVGVDSACGGTLRMTTDEYFVLPPGESGVSEQFDAIFIDANHNHAQVYKDATSALTRLNVGGMLFMHDCSPPTVHYENPSLCETAWRAFAKLRECKSLDAIVADWDCGIGMVRFGANPQPIECGKTMDEMRWVDFEDHRKDWMRMSTPTEVSKWLMDHERVTTDWVSGR